MTDYEVKLPDLYEPNRILNVQITEKMVFVTVSWKVKQGYRAESVSLSHESAVSMARQIIAEVERSKK